jgi:D-alanyl-lipoteichoic acid acyltransferase DltB (MBOAT superfamily)
VSDHTVYIYFAILLAIAWLGFRVLPWRGWVLLVASAILYAAAGWRDCAIAAAIIIVNYAFQFPIARDRRWLWPALGVNVGCLAYFKYTVFTAGLAGADLFTGPIVIPLGISFHVFQLSAFLIDIARGNAVPFRSLARFALFRLFFAQLVAGPIMRWRQFGPQVDRLFDGKPLRGGRLAGVGLGLCLLGLAKKIGLADQFAPFVEAIFRDGPHDAAAAWLGAWLFAFQIYFDFSGYSDIALGLGLMFGIMLARNFAAPFLATGIGEFWQRWHMTLAQFLRDYVFMPLGETRRVSRRYRIVQHFAALPATMTLCGLWHGLGWNFVVWGGLQGIAMIFAATWRRRLPALPAVVTWAATLGFFVTTLVFFRSANLAAALDYLAVMSGLGESGSARVPADGAGGLWIVAGCLTLLALHWCEAQLLTRRATRLLLRLDGYVLRVVFIGSATLLLLLTKAQQIPFIYFRF